MLFVLAMCAVYSASEWRRVIALVTSFTIGHSITLALAVFEVVKFKTSLIEFLIPVTILLTCLFNFTQANKGKQKGMGFWSMNNFFALAFGLIHGMGFSNYLKSLLGPGKNIVLELFAFNVGIELGQLLIVLIVLLVNLLFTGILPIKKRDWVISVSSAAGAIALLMIFEQGFSAVF